MSVLFPLSVMQTVLYFWNKKLLLWGQYIYCSGGKTLHSVHFVLLPSILSLWMIQNPSLSVNLSFSEHREKDEHYWLNSRV